MSEEQGESIEVVNEMVLESVAADEGLESQPRWHRYVAMTTLIMALIAAVGSLLAGITAHETILDRSRELVDVAIVENDQGNIETLLTKIAILESLGETPDPADLARIEAYEAEIALASEEASEEEASVMSLSSIHLVLAVSVTLVSIALTLSGMAVLVNQKSLWYFGMAFAVVGGVRVIYGVVQYLA